MTARSATAQEPLAQRATVPKAPWRRALVVGSYPPVPGAPAAATVAAVRRAWDAGAEVVVVSPRPSAAPFVVPFAGPAVARELAKLRVAHACNEVVLCLEPGWPFGARNAARTARALARALSGFETAEIVVTGELGLGRDVLAMLWPLVEPVTASSEEAARGLREAGTPAVRTVDPSAGSGLRRVSDDVGNPGPVGPLEPAELLVVARGRRFLGLAARRLLGEHAPAVRLYLRRLLRPITGGPLGSRRPG
ncbi:MAG TPA: hypothetical protein VMS00_09580 [Acidimicrobiales bacterium]|nr:hypothetical protein [Acidimicrobiales bacterium]